LTANIANGIAFNTPFGIAYVIIDRNWQFLSMDKVAAFCMAPMHRAPSGLSVMLSALMRQKDVVDWLEPVTDEQYYSFK
jgi:hypothetical protein